MKSERAEIVYRKLTITFETEEEEVIMRDLLGCIINLDFYVSERLNAPAIAKRLLQTMDAADGMPDPSWVNIPADSTPFGPNNDD